MEAHTQVRVRVIALNLHINPKTTNLIDSIDSQITEVVESNFQEGFEVNSMTDLTRDGTSYAVAIVFKRTKLV